MPIVDMHAHVYPDKIARRASDSTSEFYHMPSLYDGRIATLLEEGTAAGISHFIIQSVATTPHQVSGINRFIAATVAAGDGRFTGLGTLHPDSESVEADLAEIVALGLKGVKLHPDIQRFGIDEARLDPIYALCREAHLPILMHTGDHRFDYSNPNRMQPVLARYRGLTVIGAHFGGWSVWGEAVRLLSEYPDFYVDCSSSLYAMSPTDARALIAAYGTERVLFGTDYPMWDIKTELCRFMALDLTEEERRAILAENAARMFGIR
jgi:predicted TIM-barrel fold metal-dependent hydrolase